MKLTVCGLFALPACVGYSLRIHHRIWDPAKPQPPFSLRANLQVFSELDSNRLIPEDHVELALDHDQPENTLYQVALERESDLSESDWDISSVKACYLPQAQEDIINIHVTSPDSVPHAIDFFLSPTPHDGSCPKRTSAQMSITFPNTTLNFRFASPLPLPELNAPPPLSLEGVPIQPEPEKSFIQKYWMYFAIALLTLMLTGGAPEEEGQGRAGGARAGGR